MQIMIVLYRPSTDSWLRITVFSEENIDELFPGWELVSTMV